MKKLLFHHIALALFLWLASQGSGRAQCEIPTNLAAFPEGTVTYSIDPAIPNILEGAILTAIGSWDSGLTNTTFTRTNSGGMLRFQVSPTAIPGCGRFTPINYNGATGELMSGVVEFAPESNQFAYDQMIKTAAHEMGHSFGLGHPATSATCSESTSIMVGTPAGQCLRTTFPPGFLKLPADDDRDAAALKSNSVTSAIQQHDLDEQYCAYDYGNWDPYSCYCDYDNRGGLPGPGSPILINLKSSRLELTDAAHGVDFDIDGDGALERIAWTASDEPAAFLCLDRNFDGVIDNGRELFGNFTAQPASTERQGFLALQMVESTQLGGNGDGIIDASDSVFEQLKLWTDANHNGIAEPSELSSLHSSGVVSIDLNYQVSKGRDRFGNEFRYFSLVRLADGRVTRAVDVFLVRE